MLWNFAEGSLRFADPLLWNVTRLRKVRTSSLPWQNVSSRGGGRRLGHGRARLEPEEARKASTYAGRLSGGGPTMRMLLETCGPAFYDA
jgi:hypothetical protein